MVKILVLGDSHIPRRARSLPEEIIDRINILIKDSKFEHVLFTGDVIKAHDMMKYLKSTSSGSLYKVLGNMDYYGGDTGAPLYQELQFKTSGAQSLIIGLTHGAQVEPRGDRAKLEKLALEKKCNILISGHTHKEEIHLTKNGILLLNPGSSTGSWSFLASGNPSFMVIDLSEQNQKITIFLFQLLKNQEEIIETKFQFIFLKGNILTIS